MGFILEHGFLVGNVSDSVGNSGFVHLFSSRDVHVGRVRSFQNLVGSVYSATVGSIKSLENPTKIRWVSL